MRNTYSNPVKVIIGRGSIERLPELLMKRKAVLVTTSGMMHRGVVDRVLQLCGSNVVHVSTRVVINPTISSIEGCFAEVWGHQYDVVIGLGGGSALDTAKVVALLSGGSVRVDWLRTHLCCKMPKPVLLKSKPLIAIPTTAGSGSEVTPWAAIRDDVTGDKYSVTDDLIYPEYALLDSSLTDTLPYDVTIGTAFDALSHAMESIWNKNANPVSDALAAKAIALIIPMLSEYYKERYGESQIRDGMLQASLLAGMAFSNTKTALAHSISYPLTSILNIPHSIASSFTLPEIMRANYMQCAERVGIVVDAMQCSSLEFAIEKLYDILLTTGVAEFLRKHIGDISNVTSLDFNFFTPDRAENNIATLLRDDVEEIVQRSLSNLIG